MSAKPSPRGAPSRRTPAERAAIDARAEAFPRPLSGVQIRAIKTLARGHFLYTRAGWGRHNAGQCIEYFGTQTVDALCKRGFARRRLVGRTRRVTITAAGRREAARHR
ncbi:MAG TPA: hypothetical protein VH020_16590 [Stellaceae bacterium]|jgi:hypothetical protein|nr:hypothetical protein [Stellaceae bacterium]